MKVRFQPNQTMILLTRVVNGVETNLNYVVLPNTAHQTGDVFNVRFQTEGEDTTALRAKMWRTTDEEPTDWQVTATDSTPALQRPGGFAVVAYLSGTADNAPVEARLSNYQTTTIPE